MDYFDFYDLPVCFVLDEGALRRKFLQKSKEFHPDFYTLDTEEKQEEILALSTKNNEAYKVLSDSKKRLKYILEQKGLLGDAAKNKMSPAFLMEMMEVNEAVMELQFDFDTTKYEQIQKEVAVREASLEEKIQPLLVNYTDKGEEEKTNLKKILDYYLEKRYLSRLHENLAKLEQGV
jgi:molecular chaperone HscB